MNQKGKLIIPPERSVLFVCMGNICRSPTAEGVFRAEAERARVARHLMIDSAGTGGWHVGEAPDRRADAAAQRRGLDLSRLRARQVSPDDFARFGWILAMDRTNLGQLQAMKPPHFQGHLGLFMDFAPELATPEVPDPYYGGLDGFDYVLDLIEEASRAFLSHLQRTVVLPSDNRERE